jgi:hypothetical protein
MKVRAEAFGLPWKLCFWRPAYFIVTTKVVPHKKIIFPEIIIWGHRGNRFTDRVAKSLYRNDNIDFRAGAWARLKSLKSLKLVIIWD